MSWAQELYRVYEQQCGVDQNDGNVLLPISHSTANAQIEVTLRQDGSFVAARALPKEEGMNTIIPVSAASGKRSGKNPPPHPLTDKLFYLAGDAKKFTVYKIIKKKKIYIESNKFEPFHNEYLKQLKMWKDSNYSHPALTIIYSYLEKGTLLQDLLTEHIIQLKSGELEDTELSRFVRFIIQYTDLFAENRTWLDQSLYDRYIDYALSLQSNAPKDLCYATGKLLPIIDNTEHSKQIIPQRANAKLICINNQPLTYAGRFQDDKQALRISYDFSQKMHNALRWLIQRQGIHFDTMTLLIWTSALSDPPDIMNAAVDEDDPFDEPITPDTEPLYRDYLRKCIFGTKSFKITSKVMIMGVDAATTGRLSIALYEELERSRLLESLFRWHAETSVMRYFSQKKRSCPNSFAVKDIVTNAYGLQNKSGNLEVKPEILKDGVLRLLPCITQGRRLPVDIVQNLVKKASEPLAFPYQKGDKHPDNHRIIIETACGMIRKQNIEQGKGVIAMAYDPNETDRSYLYGCLLAIANAAEYASYEGEDKGKRITNAKRYWSMFSKRPYTTWGIIEGQLREYMKKLGAKSLYYDRMLDEIMGKFNADEFENNAPLKPIYLLGYHHYDAEIYKKKEEE